MVPDDGKIAFDGFSYGRGAEEMDKVAQTARALTDLLGTTPPKLYGEVRVWDEVTQQFRKMWEQVAPTLQQTQELLGSLGEKRVADTVATLQQMTAADDEAASQASDFGDGVVEGGRGG